LLPKDVELHAPAFRNRVPWNPVRRVLVLGEHHYVALSPLKPHGHVVDTNRAALVEHNLVGMGAKAPGDGSSGALDLPAVERGLGRDVWQRWSLALVHHPADGLFDGAAQL
jgi:hypothetical protein